MAYLTRRQLAFIACNQSILKHYIHKDGNGPFLCECLARFNDKCFSYLLYVICPLLLYEHCKEMEYCR